jgi:sigma-B regulation protein RsbU (phosphoserine phosphatase)
MVIFMKRTLSEAQLYTLLESMKLINSTLDLDRLLSIIMQEITINLDADRGTLYIVDETSQEIWSKIAQGDKKLEIRQPIGKGISGYVAKTAETINIPDAYQDSRFNQEVDKKSGYKTKSILCIPVLDKTGKVIAVLQILNKKTGRFNKKDQNFASVFADYISLAIQNAQLYQDALERKKLENEIEVAGEIQKMLIPASPPQVDNYELFAFHHPSKFIGGDYYDFFLRPDSLSIIVADVSGKGIPAAMLMANLQATVHNLFSKNQSNKQIVSLINKHLYSVTTPDKYATLVWGSIGLIDHVFHYITAGHIPPLLFSKNGKSIQAAELPQASIPVGMIPEFDFEEGTAQLHPNDLLLICSDGITEAHNKNEEMFESKRLKQIVMKNYHQPLNTIGNEIIQQVKIFTRGGSYEDDISLLMIRRKS